MTISSTNRISTPANCNGSTVAFPFSFKVFATSDIEVILTNSSGVETVLTLTTHYTVSLNVDQSANPGGTVITVATYASGNTITITSNVPRTQTLNLTLGGAFNPEVIEDALDRCVILVQQTGESIDRALRAPASDGDVDLELPNAATRANGALGFDDDGNPEIIEGGAATAASVAASASAASSSASAAAASAAAAAASAASISGDHVDEKFSNGVHFTSGVTTVLTLANTYGAESNILVFWDGTWKNPDTYTLSGATLTFSSAISATTVWVKAGKALPSIDTSVFLQKAGGTMTGAITLAADPAAAMQPATKQYTDAADTALAVAYASADDTVSKLAAVGQGKQCPYDALTIDYASASTATVAATNLVLRTSGGVGKLFASLSVTLNIASAGAGGLDTGSEASSTWYHMWAIGKSDGTVSAVFSTSTSAPTLPGGYTYYGYLGAIRNDGSSNFVEMYQRGGRVNSARTQIISGGTNTTVNPATSISLATVVPPTAVTVRIEVQVATSLAGVNPVYAFLAPKQDNSGAMGASIVGGAASATNSVAIIGDVEVTMQTLQTVYYNVNVATSSLLAYSKGWTF